MELRRKYCRSGAGAIPKKEQLTDIDRLVLSLMGEEPVTGIPGLTPTPLVRVPESTLLAAGGSASTRGNRSNRGRTPKSSTVSRAGPTSTEHAPVAIPDGDGDDLDEDSELMEEAGYCIIYLYSTVEP